MTNVTLLPATTTADGYDPDDVVVDGDGIWRRRAPLPGWWLTFGGRAETHIDDLTQPLTLVCRAGEVTDLARARQAQMALMEENAELERLASGACKTISHLGTISSEGSVVETALSAVRGLRADLERLDAVRGGE